MARSRDDVPLQLGERHHGEEELGLAVGEQLHLSGAYFAPVIGPTVQALTELGPDLLVHRLASPAHARRGAS
jgi:hypothetical protein